MQRQTQKDRISLSLLTGFIGVVALSLLILGGVGGWRLYQRSKQPKIIPYVLLDTNGQVLNIKENYGSKTQPRVTEIASIPKSDTSFYISEKGFGPDITIQDGTEKLVHSGATVSGAVYSPKRKAVYFIETRSNHSGASPSQSLRMRVWSWTHSQGFRPLTREYPLLTSIHLSPDEEFLLSNAGDSSVNLVDSFIIHSLTDHSERRFNKHQNQYVQALLGRNEVLVADHSEVKGPKDKAHLAILDVEKDLATPLNVSKSLRFATAFNGSVWCMGERDGEYAVVRLNKKLDKVEEKIDYSVADLWP